MANDIRSLPALDLPLTHRRGATLYLVNPRTTAKQVILSDDRTVEEELIPQLDAVALFEAALDGTPVPNP